jgi:hypothetical protein
MTQNRPRTRHPRRSQAIQGIRALTWSSLLLSLLVVLAACGNDDSEAATEAPAEATAEAAPAAEDGDDGGSEDDTAADSDEDAVSDAIADLASESGSATVTIGDETIEFSLSGTQTIDGTTYVGRCQSLFGMINGSGFATDGRDITLNIEIPPVDWETYEDERFEAPGVEVEDNESNAKWVADQADEFVSGSGVGEYQQEGVTASGAATFVNHWAPDSDPVEGTFEIDCEA